MKVSELTPDPVRDPPKGCGTYQSPGGVAIAPGRAQVDNRFNRYPMTYRVLMFCCAHAKAHYGTFWVSQQTIGAAMGCSKQAVSQHFRRLIEYGYIQKLRKEQQGIKGALWRIIYDPTMSWADVKAWAQRQPKTEDEIEAAVQDTLEQARKGAKGQQSKVKPQLDSVVLDPVDNFKHPDDKVKPDLDSKVKVQLNPNYNINNIREEDIKGSSREICNIYARIHERVTGRRWLYNLKQEQVAAELIRMGYTAATFEEDARELINYRRMKGQDIPYSLQFFVTRKANKGNKKEVRDYIKMAVANTRIT